MYNVKFTDTLIYLVWAHQGVLMDDISMDENNNIVIHVSVPSNSFIRDEKNEILASKNLLNRVNESCEILRMSSKFNQGIDIKFIVEERLDDWTKNDASTAVKEMMEKMFLGNPFQGAM